MKPINAHTLDEWLFEYVEGNLAPAERGELEGYLMVNPEAKAELAAWQAAVVPAKPVHYPNSQALMRPAFSGGWIMGLSGLFVLALVGLLMGGWWRSPTKTTAQTRARVHGIMGQLATLNLPEPATELSDPTPNLFSKTQTNPSFGQKKASPPAAKQLTQPTNQRRGFARKKYLPVETIEVETVKLGKPDHPDLTSRVITFSFIFIDEGPPVHPKTKPPGKTLKRVPLDGDAF